MDQNTYSQQGSVAQSQQSTAAPPSHQQQEIQYQQDQQDQESYPQQQQQQPQGDAQQASENEAKIFVGGLSFDTTEEGLKRYFQKFGVVTKAVLIMHKMTGRPRGFGFVTFEDKRVIDAVMRESHELDGRRIEPKPAVAQGAGGRQQRGGSGVFDTKLFVGGLPPSATQDDLKSHFSQYGEVTNCVVMIDRQSNRSRGFGFVTFADKQSTKKCLAEQSHMIHDKIIDCKPATPRGFNSNKGGYNNYGGRYGDNNGYGYGGGDGYGYGNSGYGRGYGGPGGYDGGYNRYGNQPSSRGYGSGYGDGYGGGYSGGPGYGGYDDGYHGGYGGHDGYGQGPPNNYGRGPRGPPGPPGPPSGGHRGGPAGDRERWDRARGDRGRDRQDRDRDYNRGRGERFRGRPARPGNSATGGREERSMPRGERHRPY